MHLQIIIGSVRDGRVAKPVADWTHRVASDRQGFSLEMIDLKEENLPMFNLPKSPIMGNYESPVQQNWAEKIGRGDAYIFISPEYNHGYSPALKNAMDYLYAEWNRKPASVVTYGGVQGARSLEQLRQVMIELQIVPLRDATHILNVWNKVKDDRFTPEEIDSKQLNKMLDELTWWGNTLLNAKENNK